MASIKRPHDEYSPDVEYIDVMDYVDNNYPFQIFMGGWGVGKTYSALRGMINEKYKFIYMRRTTEQLDALTDKKYADLTNPFKSVNRDYGWNVGFQKLGKKLAGIYHREKTEKGENLPVGEPIGAGISLFGTASMRGMDMTDMEFWIYDEFCKELHEPKRKGEFRALIRAYETIARNKEIQTGKKMPMFLFSNTDDLYNEVLIGFGLVHDAERMVANGEHHKYYKNRGLALHILETPESLIQAKSQTALYKLMQGTNIVDVALKNEFGFADFSYVKYLDIRGFRPLYGLGKAYIYKKKGEKLYYISYAKAQCKWFNPDIPTDITAFLRTGMGLVLQDEIPVGNVRFESYDLKAFIYEILGI